MLNSKKIVAIIVILLLIIGICTQVQASGLIDLENIMMNGNEVSTNTTNTNQITANQIAANQLATNQIVANQTAVNDAGSVIQPTSNRISNSTTSGNDLPQTGVTEDITVMFFIVVCVILAIYAYKKIRDYR